MSNIYDADVFSSDIEHVGKIVTSEVHNHDYYEIYFFLGDKMNYFLDSTPLILRKNDIVLVDRYLYHKTVYQRNGSQYRINIRFNDLFLRDFLGEKYARLFRRIICTPILRAQSQSAIKTINDLMNKLCACFNQGTDLSLQKGYHVLSELLLTFIDNADNFFVPVIEGGLSSVQKRMAEIARYINENYTEKLTLQYIADKFFLNKFYLCHSFKEVSGIGITDFINKKRASEAAHLLRNSHESVTKIGQLVGFNTQAYFISVFKKYYATTPSGYKARSETILQK